MIKAGGRDLIYLDNAATSLPKPPSVLKAISDALSRAGNPGRSGHFLSYLSSKDLFDAREKIARLLNFEDSGRVILTPNATFALNAALKGTLKRGDHVVTTVMEHNSVIRPLTALQEKGIEVTYVEADHRGRVDSKDLIRAVKERTRMISMVHASNVTGEVYDIESASDFCRKRGLIFLIDASQTAGVVDIDAKSMGMVLIAASGHKALFGPQGTGFLCIGNGLDISPLTEGGTGSRSEEGRQPDFYPDRMEAGTMNSVGFAGLAEGVSYVLERGPANILKQKRELIGIFKEIIGKSREITYFGCRDSERMVGILLINVDGMDPAECSLELEEAHGILVRPGLHCAPLAHRALGTFPMGALRISFSALSSGEDVEAAARALLEVSKKR